MQMCKFYSGSWEILDVEYSQWIREILDVGFFLAKVYGYVGFGELKISVNFRTKNFLKYKYLYFWNVNFSNFVIL